MLNASQEDSGLVSGADSYLNYTEYIDYPFHLERLKWLFEKISSSGREQRVRILDVGCGTGNITIPLGLIENSEVIGIDIHQPSLDHAINKNPFDNVRFDLVALRDYDIREVDYIILSEVLEHISGYEDIVQYISENSKHGATLLLTIPNGYGPFEISQQPLYLLRRLGFDSFINSIKNMVNKKEPYSLNYETPHVNFFTLKKLRKQLEKYDLSIYGIKNAFILTPIIETFFPFIPLQLVATIDNKVAQHIPSYLASGWYIEIRHRI